MRVYPTHWVSSFPDYSKPQESQAYEIRSTGDPIILPCLQTTRLRNSSPADPYGRGIGTGIVLGDEVDTDESVARWVKSFFLNNCVPNMLVGIEGAQETQLKRYSAEWNQKHKGPLKSGRTHFYDGKLTVTELGKSFDKLKINDLRQWQRSVFQSVYGIPPEILGQTQSSSRAASREAGAIFGREVVDPRAGGIADALQVVADAYNDGLIVGYVSTVPADKELRLDTMRAAPWAVSVNEWRAACGLGQLDDGGDLHYINGKMQTIIDASLDDESDNADKAAQCGCAVMRSGEHIAFKTLPPAQQAAVDRLVDSSVLAVDYTDTAEKYVSTVYQWGGEALGEVGATVSFNVADPKVVSFVEDFSGARIQGINDTTRAIAREQIAAGIQAGEGAGQIAKRLTESMGGVDRSRSVTIARTEVNRGSNFGKLQGYSQSGVVEHKEWLAAEGYIGHPTSPVRDAHVALNRETVPIDGPFSYLGYTAKYPGDFGVPELDINCRCVVLPVVGDYDESRDVESIAKQFIATTDDWIDAMADDVTLAIEAPAQRVIDGLPGVV